MPEFDQGLLLSDSFCETGDLSVTAPREAVVVAVFGEDADTSVLRVMALDLLASLKRGVPQSATRAVKNFEQAWNAAADTQITADGRYTRETEGALNAALASLAPNAGTAPAAVL